MVKNFCSLLLLSNGIPMFRAGDEFLNTQFGNNNPHNQDNEIGCLDWSQLQASQDVFRFFKDMIAFRKSHPSLCRSRFWREDVFWYGTEPTVDLSPESRSLAICLHGASQADDDIYLMVNAYWQELQFQSRKLHPRIAYGIGHIGWHAFRHAFRSLLDETGAPLKVQQELMRHADTQTRMNIYGRAMEKSKHEAHGKVVRLVLSSQVA